MTDNNCHNNSWKCFCSFWIKPSKSGPKISLVFLFILNESIHQKGNKQIAGFVITNYLTNRKPNTAYVYYYFHKQANKQRSQTWPEMFLWCFVLAKKKKWKKKKNHATNRNLFKENKVVYENVSIESDGFGFSKPILFFSKIENLFKLMILLHWMNDELSTKWQLYRRRKSGRQIHKKVICRRRKNRSSKWKLFFSFQHPTKT